jgi:hypothetical protein
MPAKVKPVAAVAEQVDVLPCVTGETQVIVPPPGGLAAPVTLYVATLSTLMKDATLSGAILVSLFEKLVTVSGPTAALFHTKPVGGDGLVSCVTTQSFGSVIWNEPDCCKATALPVGRGENGVVSMLAVKVRAVGAGKVNSDAAPWESVHVTLYVKLPVTVGGTAGTGLVVTSTSMGTSTGTEKPPPMAVGLSNMAAIAARAAMHCKREKFMMLSDAVKVLFSCRVADEGASVHSGAECFLAAP